ncbi:N-acetylmuramoyl-L-alanine amidase [Clostridium culturomicium]|uniref:N-acetylmuramoyl-L-alanine amidase n=1 Tax=Clostridium culturomicium TaxID=1499683 RepID=UPI00058F99AD|nr:N-acetylmuramoyl-L-alanine amidase [Clostridium culturomicium]
MARLCFDYGHGGNDPGATYKGRKEAEEVLNIGKKVAAEVRRFGVIVDETRTSDKAVTLKERSNYENKSNYDYFISFHRNAFKPEQARGVETFIYLNPGARAEAMAEKIQKALVAVGFSNRGVKRENFHVLRETVAPAILVEMGFLDNSKDNQIFDSKKRQIIEALASAILQQLGIKYTQEQSKPTVNTLYRVMVGSYANRENAEKQIQRLKEAGFDAVVMIGEK